MKDYTLLPEDSKAWVYQANRKLSNVEVSQINTDSTSFIDQWAAHGNELHASVTIKYNLFVVIFVDEQQAMASGCSIDSLMRFIQELEKKYLVSFLDRMQVAYRSENNDIQLDHMDGVKSKISKGELTDETIVFNNLVDTKHAFENNWEVQLKNSWHKQLL